MTEPSTDFAATKLLLMRGGEMLTHLRDEIDSIPYPGHWDLPGGGREGDETPMECGLRELFEEYSLTLPPERLTARAFPSMSRPGLFSWLLVGAITEAEIAAIRFGDEGQEWRMMPVADYLAHPRSVPAFRNWISAALGQQLSSGPKATPARP